MDLIVQCNVRINKLGHLELFYYNEDKDLVCFSFEEGHSPCDYHYMLSCKLVNQLCTDIMIEQYNNIDSDSRVIFVHSKRLYK